MGLAVWRSRLLAAILPIAILLAATSDRAVAGGCPNAKTRPHALQMDEARAALRCLINRGRNARGLARVGANRPLRHAAVGHTVYMQRHDCWSHQCKGEPSLYERVKREGYLSKAKGWGLGETMAWGEGRKGRPRAIFRSWMESPGHRAVILDPDFRDLGVGPRHGSPYKRMKHALTVTADFGYRRD